MSSRSHAVIIVPEKWSRGPAELAQLLAPIVGVPSAQLVGLLSRGPMTVEADLSAQAAANLCERLCRMGLPAAVEGGATGPELGPEPAASAESAESQRVPQLTIDTSAEFGSFRESSGGEARYTPPTRRASADDDADANAKIRGTLAGMKRATVDSDLGESPWGSVFPDIDRAPPEHRESTALGPPGREKKPVPPSLDDLESEPMLSRGAAPPRKAQPPALPPALPLPLPPGVPSDPPTRSAASSKAEKLPLAPRQTSSGGGQRKGEPRGGKPGGGKPASEPAGRGFDGARIASAFTPEVAEDRPPYAPTGFDDRLEHQPKLAAALSALAPGAGQIYNGDDGDALFYGMRFWMVRPWIESVRRARGRAEKIRDYWAPRPDPRAALRALRYLVLWQLAVLAAASILIWMGLRVYDLATRAAEPGLGAADVGLAVEEARTDALSARIAALDAVAAEREKNPTPQFTMSDEERAERLYRIGYEHCAARNYEMCEMIMRRVTGLRSGHRGAFRLQAWAGVQQKSAAPGPMPDVGEVESLDEFEARQLSDEMNMPYVPVERPADDAGEVAAAPDEEPDEETKGEMNDVEPPDQEMP